MSSHKLVITKNVTCQKYWLRKKNHESWLYKGRKMVTNDEENWFGQQININIRT